MGRGIQILASVEDTTDLYHGATNENIGEGVGNVPDWQLRTQCRNRTHKCRVTSRACPQEFSRLERITDQEDSRISLSVASLSTAPRVSCIDLA